jgi:hypothetical protein
MGAMLDALDRVEAALVEVSETINNDVFSFIVEDLKLQQDIGNSTNKIKMAIIKSMYYARKEFKKYSMEYDSNEQILDAANTAAGQVEIKLKIGGVFSRSESILFHNIGKLRIDLANAYNDYRLSELYGFIESSFIDKIMSHTNGLIFAEDIYEGLVSGSVVFFKDHKSAEEWAEEILKRRHDLLPIAIKAYAYGKKAYDDFLSIINSEEAQAFLINKSNQKAQEYLSTLKEPPKHITTPSTIKMKTSIPEQQVATTAAVATNYRIEIANGTETIGITTQEDPKKFLDAIISKN